MDLKHKVIEIIHIKICIMKKVNLFAICIMVYLLAGCEPKVTEQKPTVLTLDVTEVTTHSAQVSCNVVSDGGTPVIDRGVAYDIYPNPKATGTKCKAGTGTGKYTCSLTELQDNKRYYVRAYARNDIGIEYGKEMSFMTIKELFPPSVLTGDVSNIKGTSVVVKGSVTNDGGVNIIEFGIVYGTSQTPTINNSKVLGEGKTDVFTCTLTNLEAKTTYYARAYAINEIGIGYGEEISFSTRELIMPSVSISSIENISYSSACIKGNIFDDGGSDILECGVCYSTSQNPTTKNSHIKIEMPTQRDFTCNLSNLKSETTYYIRTYARNGQGTAYSDQQEFTTRSHEYIDLGLSVKWATCNVGAENPHDRGYYFQWACTEEESYYDETTRYSYVGAEGYSVIYSKYTTASHDAEGKRPDNKTILDLSDDAARVNWGGSWRMPTKEEFEELIENCTWSQTTQDGWKGYKVTSKKNGKSIFLPSAGYMWGKRELKEFGNAGYYWSSSLYTNYSGNDDAYALISGNLGYKGRVYGLPVRPVCP